MAQITASPSTFHGEWHFTDATTTSTISGEIEIEWNFPISYEEELKKEAIKEIKRKKECKMRNKLKRRDMFTKKGLY